MADERRRYLSIREGAELLSLSESGLRKLIARDLVPVCRLGRIIRIDHVRLVEQLEAQLEHNGRAVRG